MTVGTLDRRTLTGLIAGLAVILIIKFVFLRDREAVITAARTSVPAAEKRLEHMRQIASTVPGKEEVYKKAAAELADRERYLIKAETVQQAQVTLLEMLQNMARANGIDVRGSQEARDKVLSNDYGQVSVSVQFSCGIEQLVNLLGAIANQPEIISTDEIHISGGSDKKKNIQVRLSVAAAIPRKLIPEKKGVAAF